MDDDLPCPECDGWMRLQDRHWTCPSCGHRSEEVVEEDPEAVEPARPTAADLAVQQGVATSSPSYRPAAGRPRSFGLSLVLGIVTLGIYFLYWQWKVFREVHRQERNRGGSGFLWGSLAMAVVRMLVFVARGIPIVDGKPGPPDGGLPDFVLDWIQFGLLAIYLLLETKDLDVVLGQRAEAGTGAFAWIVVGLLLTGVASDLPDPAGILLTIAGTVPLLVAFHRLQAGLNRYWRSVRVRPAASAPTGLTPVPS